jgi:predicted transcriptional regulator
MPKKRKVIVQIRFEILEYPYYNSQPQPRTHVWRKATKLSYDDFIKHLDGLIEKELVYDIEGELKITRKGKETYDKLKQVLYTFSRFTTGE